MSKLRRIRIDVYGQFEADVVREYGSWVAYRRGADGKRRRLHDLLLDDDAEAEDVLFALEVVFHELGGPGAELRVVDVLMA